MNHKKNEGAALLMLLFAISLMSVMYIGYLQLLTTELQISRNQKYSEQALYVADAGIENSIRMLRSNYDWSAGFTNQQFPSGSGNTFTVTVTNNYPVVVLNSVSSVNGRYARRIEARIIVSGPTLSAPYPVRIDYWKET
jgi:type II secretory pathway component PulK